MGELYEYERKLEGEGFACGNWETKFVAEIGFLVFLLMLGFCPKVWNNLCFLLFFFWYSNFVPRGIFSRLGSHRGKSWCWPTFWGEFCHVQQPKSQSRLLYFFKLHCTSLIWILGLRGYSGESSFYALVWRRFARGRQNCQKPSSLSLFYLGLPKFSGWSVWIVYQLDQFREFY